MIAAIPIDTNQIADFCQRHYVKRLSLFGSVVRDDFSPDSDVDVLVEFEEGKTPGLAFFGMEQELARIMGRKVDLNTKGCLHRLFRDSVIRSAVPVMSKRDPIVPLVDMLDYANEISSFIGDKDKESVLGDLILKRALTHDLQVIGEAATRVDPEIRDRFPAVPWEEMIGMRNRLVHGYDTIDEEILWDTITEDIPRLGGLLPPIIEEIRRIHPDSES